jgi:DNA repair exonuclease SbcCD ATPase subunit
LEESKRQLAENHANLEKIHANLLDDHRNLKREHQEVVQSLSTAQQKLMESEEQTRAFRIQVGRLQGHLTKNATNANELIDSDVIAKLEFIRARTQSIVKKFCVGKTVTVKREIREFAEFDNDLAKKMKSILERYTQEDLEVFETYWMRSKIYKLLEREIFNQQVFGLEADLEVKFAEFERLISKHNPSEYAPS